MNDFIEVSLDAQERKLILRYGYPFPELREQLEAHKSTRRSVKLQIEGYLYDPLIGDLCYSLRTRVKDEFIADELDALITKLEFEMEDHS